MAQRGQGRRRDVMALALLVVFLGFFALTTLGWLIQTPIETVTENYDGPSGNINHRQTDLEYGSLTIPGVLCLVSLLAFTASALALARTLREGTSSN
jgi:hypothetical protein